MENFLGIELKRLYHERMSMSVYPSDAPLPRFGIKRVQGMSPPYTHTVGLTELQFEGDVENYEEISDWCANHNVLMDEYLRFYTSITYSPDVVFTDSGTRIDYSEGSGSSHVVISEGYGTWVKIEFVQIRFSLLSTNSTFTFSSPLYFCDVFIPATTLPVDVWTDLQFTTSPPIPEVSWIVLIPLAIFGIGALAYWYLKKRK